MRLTVRAPIRVGVGGRQELDPARSSANLDRYGNGFLSIFDVRRVNRESVRIRSRRVASGDLTPPQQPAGAADAPAAAEGALTQSS